jgi:hypothetical protein
LCDSICGGEKPVRKITNTSGNKELRQYTENRRDLPKKTQFNEGRKEIKHGGEEGDQYQR